MHKSANCPKCHYSFAVKFRDHRGTSHQPLLLKCSHAFCESCVIKLAKEEKKCITCPTCKVVTELSHGESGARKLPGHHYLTGYLMSSQNALLQQELSRMAPAGMGGSLSKKKSGSGEPAVRLCHECRINKATCKCLKCDCVMCGLCFDKIHSLSKSLKQHQAVQLTENDNCPFEEMSPVCKLHGKPIEYYCDDDDIAICSRCVILGAHKDHMISSMEEKNKLVLVDMEPSLQFASHVLKKLRKAEKTLSESVPSIKSETSAVTDSIREHFQALHAVLQTREEELVEEVLTVYQDGITPIIDMKLELIDEKRKLEQAIKAAQRLMNNNNELVLNAKDILDKLNKAKDVMCIVSNTEPETEIGIRFESGTFGIQALKSFGAIVGEVPKRVMFHTLNDAPGDLVSEDTDTASIVSCSSLASTTDVASTADTGEDVIIEDEQDILLNGEDGTSKAKPALKPIPGRAQLQGHCENVIVTHIRSPRQFYVQRCALSSKLTKMQKAINTWCKDLATVDDIPKDVQKDDFVLCQYSGDKVWYRGRVLSVMTTTEVTQSKTVTTKHVEVSYIDYGNHEVVTMERIREIKPRFMKNHEFLMECALSDIDPLDKDGFWLPEAATTMQQMIADKPMLMTVIREVGNVLEVDLHKPSSDCIMDDRPVSVRDCLVFLELANFVTSPERGLKAGSQSQRRRDYMKPEPRLRGESFNAVVSYSGVPSGFCIQPVGDSYHYLEALMAEMQTVYADGSNLYRVFCPQVDMICVVQSLSDGKWYRARIFELPGFKEVDVQYVDFGTIQRVPYDRINKILDDHLKLSPLALQCELSDVEPAESDGSWGVECLEWWTDLTTFQQFHVKVMEVQVDAIEVVLYRILENSPDKLSVNYQLVANGYGKSTGIGSTVLGPEKKAEEVKAKFTYRDSKKDKLQRSADIAVSYMKSPVKDEPSASQGSGDCNQPPKPSSLSASSTKTQPKQILRANKNSLTVNVTAAQQVAPKSPEKSEEVVSPSVQIEVVISAFVSPADFHLQLTQTNELKSMMTLLQQQFKNSQPVDKHWKCKDFCAAKHPVDNMWYRAKIVQRLDDDRLMVLFVDYGFLETLSSDNLRALDIKMRALSCCAIKCHLADIVSTGSSDPLQWSATACEFMTGEAKGKTLYIKKEGELESEDRGLPVDLLIEESVAETALEPCRTSVYSLIQKMKDNGLAIPCRRKTTQQGGNATSAKSVGDSEPLIECDILHYTPHPVPPSTSLAIIPTYIDYCAIIYCQCLDDETELLSMTDEIQSMYIGSKPQNVKWEVGQACISYFGTDDLWYRARVKELRDGKILVQYLDYGNSELQSLDKVRIPDEKFVKIPQLCVECVIYSIIPVSDDGKWPVTVLDCAHSIIVNHQCQIEVKKAEEGQPLEVKMTLPDGSDLGKTLIMMGVAAKPDDLTMEYDVSRKVSSVIQRRYPYKLLCLSPVGEYVPVVVTHVELPNVVWFQHVPQDVCDIDEEVEKRVQKINSDLCTLIQMSTELAQSENMGKAFIKVPACGQMCSAKFSFDECWYRGLVVDRDEETDSALVLFVDYGNVEYVYLDKLRVLTASARSLPAQGVRCLLHAVEPPGGVTETWSKHSMTRILQLLRERQLLACIKGTDPLTIELYEKKIGEDGSEVLELAYQSLIDERLAQIDITEESQLSEPAVSAPVEEMLLEEEQDADVIVENDADDADAT